MENGILFEDFLKDVNPFYHEFVEKLNGFLLQNGCSITMEPAKNGCLVSYRHTKTKRSVLNFVFRKSGLVARIYADNLNKYGDILTMLSESLIKIIKKAPDCKRLLDPAKCNGRCPMGYTFTLKDALYKKCRYNCFLLPVNFESMPFIKAAVECEIKERVS